MNPNDDLDPLGDALRKAGRDAPYPATPRLAARARSQLERQAQPRLTPRFTLLLGMAGAAIVVLLALGAVLTYQQQNAPPAQNPGKAYTDNFPAGDLPVVHLERDVLARAIEGGNHPLGLGASPRGQ